MRHQPYIFENATGLAMLLCTAFEDIQVDFNGKPTTVRPWKISWRQGLFGTDMVLNTPAAILGSPVILECSPSLCKRKGKWYLTYLAGLNISSARPIVYRVVTVPIDIDSMVVLGSDYAVAPVVTGSATKTTNNCYFVGKDLKSIQTLLGSSLRVQTDYQQVTRVINVFDSEQLMVTLCKDSNYFSGFFDPNTLAFTRVQNNADEDIYKCSVYKDQLAYAKKIGPDFEDREVYVETLP